MSIQLQKTLDLLQSVAIDSIFALTEATIVKYKRKSSFQATKLPFSLSLAIGRTNGLSMSQTGDEMKFRTRFPIVNHYLELGDTVILIEDDAAYNELKLASGADLALIESYDGRL